MIIKRGGVQIRLPKGQRSMSRSQEDAFSQGDSQGRGFSTSKECIVFFPKKGSGRGEAIQRCGESRTPAARSAAAKRNFSAMVRRGDICLVGRKQKRFSNHCRK